MGGVKEAWTEAQERGWDELDKHVCAACVAHVYLASLVAASARHIGCDYCGDTDVPSVTVSCILGAVVTAIHYEFNDETNTGGPYSKNFPIEYLSSYEVLEETLNNEGVAWSDALIEDVAGALHEVAWVAAPEGNFLGSHGHERLRWSWSSFVRVVKHQSRFHFYFANAGGETADDYGDQPIGAADMLRYLADMFEQNQMVKTIAADTEFLRVRRGRWPLLADDVGPPPSNKANAGRMNPAGIPYLYLAFDEPTALAEAQAVAGEDVTVSRWQPSRELKVLDLTFRPQCMSIFEGHDLTQDHVIFLQHFVADVSKPLGEGDLCEIEYVPTQLVCEYLAQVFLPDEKALDGLIYPSSLGTGKNLVLFPVLGQRYADQSLQRFSMVTFRSARVTQA
jgi:hypothetical protein